MPRVKKPDTRDNILREARILFGEKGFHDTSVSDIIGQVGLSQGSFYNYFKSKNDIFKTILLEFVAQIKQISVDIPVESVRGRLSYIYKVYKMSRRLEEIFGRDVNLTKIFFWEAVGISEEYNEIIDDANRFMTAYCRSYLERGQELNILRTGISTELTAGATIGMVLHLINRYLRGDFPDAGTGTITRTILEIQLYGIIKR